MPPTNTQHDTGHDTHHDKTIVVSVNDKPVRLPAGEITGREVKAAAIAQGVNIAQDYLLTAIEHGGEAREIGDDDTVHLDHCLEFVAIPDDDNS